MTNLVSFVDKLLRNLEELLDFFGHYEKGRIDGKRQKSGKVCGVSVWCVGKKQYCTDDVSFGGTLDSLTLSLAGTHACSHREYFLNVALF
jgi:hypothetical protein